MRVGVNVSPFAIEGNTSDSAAGFSPFGAAQDVSNLVDESVRLAQLAARHGVGAVLFGQEQSYDAVALAGLVGRAVPEIVVGTAAVPMFPLPPLLLASAAKTAQAATAGRFELGVALGVGPLLESLYGYQYPPPIRYLREYLSALRGLLAGSDDPFEGSLITSRPFSATRVVGAEPAIPMYVAATGPQALRVAGRLADGVIPFLAGPRAVSNLIAPTVRDAADKVGRVAPVIDCAVPVVVTDRPDEARERARDVFSYFEQVPSYQRILQASGAAHAADLLLTGDEDTVTAGIERYAAGGATRVTFMFSHLLGEHDRDRTWQLAGTLNNTPKPGAIRSIQPHQGEQ